MARKKVLLCYCFDIRGDTALNKEIYPVNKRSVRRKKERMSHGKKRRLTKITLSALILLVGVVVKFGFMGSALGEKVSGIINSDFDYKQAAETIGRAVSGDEKIISVFKELTQMQVQEVSSEIKADKDLEEEIIDENFYNTYNTTEEENSVQANQLDFTEQTEIEKLSFEMSEAELSDDTKAEPFVIPPPSNCSYERINISFKTCVPVYGKITSPYGYRDHPVGGDAGFHTGMDIAANKGRAVKAFAAGKVLQASTNKVYGNYVLIEHADGIRSFYGHNSKLNVKKGQRVKLGQKIAEVGSTGLSTGPHLHFEVRKGSMRLNPKYYISPENI